MRDRTTLGEVWTLRTVSEKAYVTAQWVYQHPEGDVQFGLRRVQELHKKMASGVFPVWLGKRRRSLNPDVLVGVLVIAAILVIATPGVADRWGSRLDSRCLSECSRICGSAHYQPRLVSVIDLT